MLIFDAILFGWTLGSAIYGWTHFGHSNNPHNPSDTKCFSGHEGKPNAQYKSVIQNIYGSDELNEWIDKNS